MERAALSWTKGLKGIASLMKLFLAAMLAFVLVLTGCSPKPQDAIAPLRIAAAASLKFALDAFLEDYKARHPDFPVQVTYGSSGNLKTQIEQGAPFDLFLSADLTFPDALIRSGKAKPEDLFPYAVGRLAIWVPNASPLDLGSLKQTALLDPSARKIAIANPQHAPYGQAAVAALKHFAIYEQTASRFVLGENVSQTAQFVESGAADIGIIAMSLAMSPEMLGKGRYWEIPLEAFPSMVQGGVILGASKQRQRAELFRAAILSETGRKTWERYGFALPETEYKDRTHGNH